MFDHFLDEAEVGFDGRLSQGHGPPVDLTSLFFFGGSDKVFDRKSDEFSKKIQLSVGRKLFSRWNTH